jgi:hypothetical protein
VDTDLQDIVLVSLLDLPFDSPFDSLEITETFLVGSLNPVGFGLVKVWSLLLLARLVWRDAPWGRPRRLIMSLS